MGKSPEGVSDDERKYAEAVARQKVEAEKEAALKKLKEDLDKLK